jgi:hypothetical protein
VGRCHLLPGLRSRELVRVFPTFWQKGHGL